MHAQHDHLQKEIKKIIRNDTQIDFDKTPGYIIGIIDGDSTYIVTFGHKNKIKKDTLSPQDLFQIGSVSKLYTASLIAILEDKGILSTEDAFTTYLPDGQYPNEISSITITNLLNHTSGYSKLPKGIGLTQEDPNDPYRNYTKEDLLHYVQEFQPTEELGLYNYSHTNFALLEVIIEHTLGITYMDALNQYLLQPIGCLHTPISQSDSDSIYTEGYDRSGQECAPWTFNAYTGSQGIAVSLADILLFLQMQLGIHKPMLTESIKNIDVPIINTDIDKKIKVGNAWHLILHKNKYQIQTHTGRTAGHHAFVGIVNETKTGVVILSNSAYGTEDLGFLILRMINYNWKRKST